MQAPRGAHIVEQLRGKGVSIPNPYAVDIAEDVDPDRISGDGVTLHQGTRLAGAKTVISAGCELGGEGPVTVVDCRLGPDVELKGGYAAKAVFLARSNMGLGHHVREGCLLEEEAGGAHCVGLKQTILFPFVTLGSLINFCDALMAGGRSRKDHSEVGSSYIHFNFTPSGDKTTPSLFGDVPRGVMLDQAPIFLGGQGGAVGPVQVTYGTVVGAGCVLRSDVPQPDQLVIVGPPPTMQVPFAGAEYRGLNRLLGKNFAYVAQLRALKAWYEQVRAPFFAAQPLGDLVYEGALEMLASAQKERLSRLRRLVGRVSPDDAERAGLAGAIEPMCAVFEAETGASSSGAGTSGADSGGAGTSGTGSGDAGTSGAGLSDVAASPPAALTAALGEAARSGAEYVTAVQDLDRAIAAEGTAWLSSVIEESWAQVAALHPPLQRLPRL